MEALLEQGVAVRAVTCVANPEKVDLGLKPSRSYLERLLAAKDMLSEEYYKKLESTQTLLRIDRDQ